MSRPFVSLLLPTYARYGDGSLERAIKSVLDQTYREIELVIVDDGSVDGSADLINSYTKIDSRVKHFRLERNVGLPAMTLGLAAPSCLGDYYGFVFDDCKLEPYHVECLVSCATDNPDASFVYGQANSYWLNGKSMLLGKAFDREAMRQGNNHIPNVCVLFRREMISRVGWYDPHVLLKRFCDWDLWYRMANVANPAFVPRVLATEFGTGRLDSIGLRASTRIDLMLRYAQTERSKSLQLENLQKYDPFAIDILPNMSSIDMDDIKFILTEHFLMTNDSDHLFRLYPNLDKRDIEVNYLRRRLNDVIHESNGRQIQVLSMSTVMQDDENVLATDFQYQSDIIDELKRRNELLSSIVAVREAEIKTLKRYFRWKLLQFLRKNIHLLKQKLKKSKLLLRNSRSSKFINNNSSYNNSNIDNANVWSPINILAIGDGKIPSIELILEKPLSYLSRSIGFKYNLTYSQCLPAIENCDDIDLLIVARAYDVETLSLARYLAKRGVPFIYMMDDAFDLIDSQSAAGKHLRSIGALDNIAEFGRLATTVVTFSEALARSFARYCSNVELMPAISGAESRILLNPSSLHPDEIRIGFAGSVTHADNLALIGSALQSILDDRPSVIFETIGQPFPALNGHPQYRHFPFVEGVNEFFNLLQQRAWDLGLAPLADTAFNASKTDNKYRTYGAVGIPAIYSRVPAFERSVQDGKSGFLVDNTPSAWKAAIERLLDDSKLRKKVSHAANLDVQHRFGIHSVSLRYLDLFVRLLYPLRVLAIGPLHLPSVAIDIRRPMLELSRRNHLQFRLREIAEVSQDDILWCDLVIVIRETNAIALEIVKEAKKLHKRTIFTWDDDFFSIPPEYPELRAYYESPDIRAAMEEMLRVVDLVKCTTERLARRAASYNHNVIKVPYGFDFTILKNVDKKIRNEDIIVGYFGSPGRGPEFVFLLEALYRVAAERPNTKFEFFGIEPVGVDKLPRTKIIPFLDDYEQSIQALSDRRWDIGLAPLVLNQFNCAKLPTKFRDYGATKIAGVYSKIEPYEDVVIDGYTGIMVENTPEAWYTAIISLIDNQEHRSTIAENAYREIYSKYNIEVACNAWLECFKRIDGVANAVGSDPI